MATSRGFNAFFQEVSENDVYVCWKFVGEINLMASRSIVPRMISLLFCNLMRQQPLRMYQIVTN